MYELKFEELKLIDFEFTTGDAPMGCALATLNSSKETELLEQHIEKFGESAQEGVFELTLLPNHQINDEDGKSLTYSGGLLLWVPELREVSIEVVGIAYPEYETRFPKFVNQYNEMHKNT